MFGHALQRSYMAMCAFYYSILYLRTLGISLIGGTGPFTPTPPPLPAGFWLGSAGPWAPKAP